MLDLQREDKAMVSNCVWHVELKCLCKMSPEEESKQDLPYSSSVCFVPWSPWSEAVIGPRGDVSLHGYACARGHECTSVLQDVSEQINSALAL